MIPYEQELDSLQIGVHRRILLKLTRVFDRVTIRRNFQLTGPQNGLAQNGLRAAAIESRRCKDFSYSMIPNTVHSVLYCPVTLSSTSIY